MSIEEFAGLGFAPGSVKGVRSFSVDKYGRLTGIHYPQVWLPGENHAECKRDDSVMYTFQALAKALAFDPYGGGPSFGKRGRARSSSAPALPATPPVAEAPVHVFEDCACGFYGYFDGSDDYHDKGRITAVVEAYGEIVIGTRGFRAMKARILAIRVKPEDDGVTGAMARKIGNNYKSVAIFDSFETMVREFPPDTSLEPSPETYPDFWTRS